jgi:hypothetical protein
MFHFWSIYVIRVPSMSYLRHTCSIYVPAMCHLCSIYGPLGICLCPIFVPCMFHFCSICVPLLRSIMFPLRSIYILRVVSGPVPGPWHQKRNRSRTEMEHRWTQNGTYMEHRWNRLGKCNINIKTSLLVTENPISYHLINHSARCSNIPPRRLLGCGLCC